MWGHRLRNSSSVALDVCTQAEPAGSELLGCVCRSIAFLWADGHQRIHAQTIVTFVFQERTLTTASMPQTIRTFLFQEHTLTTTFVFQEHTLTTASMPKP